MIWRWEYRRRIFLTKHSYGVFRKVVCDERKFARQEDLEESIEVVIDDS